MKKFLKRVLAPVVVGAMLVGVAAPAAAEPEVTGPSDATAWSQGIGATPGNLQVKASLSGGLGWLLGWAVNPLVNGLLTPVTSIVNAVPAGLVNGIAKVAAPGAHAETPPEGTDLATERFAIESQPAPVVGTPVSCSKVDDTCYAPALLGLVPSIDLNLGLASLRLGLVTGTTEPIGTRDDWDLVSQSHVAGLNLGLLGIDLLNLDAVSSRAVCSAVGPAYTHAEAGVASLSLLGGLLSVGVANDGSGVLVVKVGDQPLLGDINLRVDGLNLLGNVVDLSVTDRLLQLRLGLDIGLPQLLQQLGVDESAAADLNSVLSLLADISLTLQAVVEVGTQAFTDETQAQATGLHVGLGINLALRATLASLIGVRLNTVGSGASIGSNVIGLDLARTSCGSTSTPSAVDTWIDPGLT